MKKILFSLVCLLSLGNVTMADEVKTYEPDQFYTTVEQLTAATDGFAIVDTTDQKAVYGANNQNTAYDVYSKAFASTNSVIKFKAEAGEGGYYLRAVTPAGGDYGLWGNNICYLNSQPTGGVSFILGKDQDGTNCSLFNLTYSAENAGWTLQCVANGKYLGKPSMSDDPVYFQLCSIKEVSITNPIEPGKYDATDANVLKTAEVATSNVTLSWESGMDYDSYKYIVITLGQNSMGSGNAGIVTIKDGNGVTIAGDAYGVAYQNMWFGSWNHQFTCGIDLEKLRSEQMLNLHDIRELSIGISGSVLINSIYATNQEAKTVNRWSDPANEGTYRILDKAAEAFGTVCLPYQASYAGCSIYEIAGKSESNITLTPLTGLMEAGKPYFYQVNTPLNPSDEATKTYAFFYKASTATDVVSPVANNGLVGTFADNGNVPTDAYVLSGNKLYKVDSTIPFTANHAYIDLTAIEDKGTGVKTITINDATAINSTSFAAAQPIEIYSVSGAKMNTVQRGINVVKMNDGTTRKYIVK